EQPDRPVKLGHGDELLVGGQVCVRERVFRRVDIRQSADDPARPPIDDGPAGAREHYGTTVRCEVGDVDADRVRADSVVTAGGQVPNRDGATGAPRPGEQLA